jgi:predicted small integral membrane protein
MKRDLNAHPLRLSGVNLIRARRAAEAAKRRDNYFALSALTLAASISYVGYLVIFA